MKEMGICVDALSAMLQFIVIIQAFYIFGKCKVNHVWQKTIIALIYVAFNTLATMFLPSGIILMIAVMLFVFCVSFCFKMSIFRHVFSTVMICLILVLFEMAFGIILSLIHGLNVSEVQDSFILSLLAVLFSKLTLYLLIRVFNAKLLKNGCKVSYKLYICLLLMPLASFVVLNMLSNLVIQEESFRIKISIFIASTLLIFSNIFIYVIYDYTIKQKNMQNQLEKNTMVLKAEKQYYTSFVEKQKLSNKTLHDMKNKLYAIKSLMQTDIDAAKSEINSMADIISAAKSIKITGIEAIDGLLEVKKNLATSKGIAIKCSAFMPTIIEYNIVDLCVIVGNILDNAIEAVGVIEDDKEKVIYLEIREMGNHLSITSYNQTINSSLESNKEDKHLHGFGLNSICELAEKNNGNVRYHIDESVFRINVIVGKTFAKNDM